jgi:hypothetical protein
MLLRQPRGTDGVDLAKLRLQALDFFFCAPERLRDSSHRHATDSRFLIDEVASDALSLVLCHLFGFSFPLCSILETHF